MTRETSWSLFDGGGFRYNPLADEGQLNAFVFAFEGGHVRGLDRVPRGGAFRLEAEVGQDLGGDFSFNRYLGDVRVYAPVGYTSTLALRLRGGLVEGDAVPFQKLFSLGGIGSMRAYPQNLFVGSHMLLGNVEYSIHDIGLFDDILDDLMLSGFLDAGWVSDSPFDTFDFDDVVPSAGLGLGLADRTVRLELAWPLRDIAGSQNPTLWLRINPPF
jgi:hemolysin activation/secretion protein